MSHGDFESLRSQPQKAIPQPIFSRRHLRRNSMLRVPLGQLMQPLHN